METGELTNKEILLRRINNKIMLLNMSDDVDVDYNANYYRKKLVELEIKLKKSNARLLKAKLLANIYKNDEDILKYINLL